METGTIERTNLIPYRNYSAIESETLLNYNLTNSTASSKDIVDASINYNWLYETGGGTEGVSIIKLTYGKQIEPVNLEFGFWSNLRVSCPEGSSNAIFYPIK